MLEFLRESRESEVGMANGSPHTISKLGKTYCMPKDIATGSDDEKKAWARGFFMTISGRDTFETKDITVTSVGKVYERLEIHNTSPQMYMVLAGKVEIPAAESLDGEKAIYTVSEGEAIVLNPNVWHGGASGIDVPATVFIVLNEGTTQHDTQKVNLSLPIKLGSC